MVLEKSIDLSFIFLKWFAVVALIFLLASFCRPVSKQGIKFLLFGLLFSLTYLLVYGSGRGFYPFFCEYMMLLPYAALSHEKEKGTGLKIFAGFYAFTLAVMSVLAVFQCLNRIPYVLQPLYLQPGFFWERDFYLQLFWHPNVLGAIFMLGTGMTVALACSTKHLWSKITLALLAAVGYLFTSLTYCRTAIILTAFIISGVVFFLIYRDNKSAKRILLALLAAAATMSVLLYAYSFIFKVHVNYQRQIRTETEEITETVDDSSTKKSHPAGESDSENKEKSSGAEHDVFGDLYEGLHGFTERDRIWKSAFKGIAENPKVLFTGVDDIPGFINGRYGIRSKAHAHNSWIQMLLSMGIWGFAFTVVISFLAIKNSFLLLFRKKSTMFQKSICLFTLAVMGLGFFEIYLFGEYYPVNFVNAVYLLCTGYVTVWAKEPENEARLR
jgi:hypothetical protein